MNPTSQIQKHPRYRVQAEVDVVDDRAAMRRLPLENSSLGGMFIRDPAPPAPGGLLRLCLHDRAGAEALGVVARVVHVIDEPQATLKQHPQGMGVKFDALSPATTEKLRVFVDKSVVEIFANDRQAIGRRVYPTRSDSLGLNLFANGGGARFESVKAWDMMPANPY